MMNTPESQIEKFIENLQPDYVGFDFGCGAGRWALLIAPRVKQLHLFDPYPQNREKAQKNFRNKPNVVIHSTFPDIRNQFDFGYSIGFIEGFGHRDLVEGLCRNLLKPNGRLLIEVSDSDDLYRAIHAKFYAPSLRVLRSTLPG